jgi:hypothetical protein
LRDRSARKAKRQPPGAGAELSSCSCVDGRFICKRDYFDALAFGYSELCFEFRKVSNKLGTFSKNLTNEDLMFRTGRYELKTVLKSATLSDLSTQPGISRNLGCAKFHPHVAPFRQLSSQDRTESALAHGYTAPEHKLIGIGLNRYANAHVQSATEVPARSSSMESLVCGLLLRHGVDSFVLIETGL